MGHQHTKSPLSIRITSSQNQSDQLFDFHRTSVKQDQKILRNTSFLVDFGETVKLVDNHILESGEDKVPDFALFKISQDPYQQVRITALGNDENRILWRVLKYGETYPIKIGEILKIGKLKMELKRIVCDKPQRTTEQVTEKSFLIEQQMDSKSVVSEKSPTTINCRICFQAQKSKNDPLICLCKCTGSIQHSHFQCLKDWITNGFQKREQKYFKFYSYGEISCEVCKQKLPLSFKYQGKDYSFFETSSMDAPYAEFESVSQQNGKAKFSRYIIDLGNYRQVLVGRNHSCQVPMKDISISRVHCSFQYKHGMLFVRDKKSKFGTLLKISDSIQFTSDNGLQLQFESHLIELYKKHFFKGCLCMHVDNYKLIFQEGTKSTSRKRQKITQGQNRQRSSILHQNQEETFSELNPSLLRTRFVRDQLF